MPNKVYKVKKGPNKGKKAIKYSIEIKGKDLGYTLSYY